MSSYFMVYVILLINNLIITTINNEPTDPHTNTYCTFFYQCILVFVVPSVNYLLHTAFSITFKA